jgi:hypothetical protein
VVLTIGAADYEKLFAFLAAAGPGNRKKMVAAPLPTYGPRGAESGFRKRRFECE